jgi:hypothetical protein
LGEGAVTSPYLQRPVRSIEEAQAEAGRTAIPPSTVESKKEPAKGTAESPKQGRSGIG